MAKQSLIQRELKREQLAAKYAKKYKELKAAANDAKKSDEERYAARLQLQQLPRNAYQTRDGRWVALVSDRKFDLVKTDAGWRIQAR